MRIHFRDQVRDAVGVAGVVGMMLRTAYALRINSTATPQTRWVAGVDMRLYYGLRWGAVRWHAQLLRSGEKIRGDTT